MSQISKIISDISGGVNVLPDDLHDKCTTFEIDIDKIKQGTRNEFDSLLDGVNKKGRNTRIDCNDRIAVLEKQIEWIEAHSRSHYRYHYHGNGNNNNDSAKSVPYSLGTKPY
jgi:hypothetical protein